jgi:hypothetical protein
VYFKQEKEHRALYVWAPVWGAFRHGSKALTGLDKCMCLHSRMSNAREELERLSKVSADGVQESMGNRVEVMIKSPVMRDPGVRAPLSSETVMEESTEEVLEGATEEVPEDTAEADALPTALEPQEDSAEIAELVQTKELVQTHERPEKESPYTKGLALTKQTTGEDKIEHVYKTLSVLSVSDEGTKVRVPRGQSTVINGATITGPAWLGMVNVTGTVMVHNEY